MAIITLSMTGQPRVSVSESEQDGDRIQRVVLDLGGVSVSYRPDEALTTAGAMLDAVAKLRGSQTGGEG